MSYHGLGAGFTASASLNTSGGSVSYSGSSSGKSDYIWDITCASRGGVRGVVSKFGEVSFTCNNGHACRQPFGTMYWQCTDPSGAKAPPPPPGPKPCSAVQVSDPCPTGTKSTSQKNGYVYTFCKDDTMFVRSPDCSVQKYSQREVGAALNPGAPKTLSFDVSKALMVQPEPWLALNANKALFGSKPTLYTGTLFQPSRSQEAATPVVSPVPESEDTMSTGTKVAIGLGVLAVAGGIFYLSRRS